MPNSRKMPNLETAETAETTDSEEAVEPGEHVEDHAEDEPEEHAEEEHAGTSSRLLHPLEAATPAPEPEAPPRSLLSPEASCRPSDATQLDTSDPRGGAMRSLSDLSASFSDANGDGVGDLVGVISGLDTWNCWVWTPSG